MRLYTVETALDSLKKYDILQSDLLTWEGELNLSIPVDEYGRKSYSPHHVNLFKNVKKHIALGRTIEQIKQIVSLPPIETSRPQPVPTTVKVAIPPQSAPVPQRSAHPQPGQLSNQPTTLIETIPPKSPYASVPKRPVANAHKDNGAAQVVNLVQHMNQEKDQLYKKLLETEKLNSHLYSANNLFNHKVREMTAQIKQLRENFNENEKLKLLDDKGKLQKQLIEAEKFHQYKEQELIQQKQKNENLQQRATQLEQQIHNLSRPFDPSYFCGDWKETGHLVEVIYDNFGINIESERVRLFRISEKPSRLYGNMAIIHTSYQYESNALWKRDETLMISYNNYQQALEGELVSEYILDGVPVAKAVYRVQCTRNVPAEA